MHNFHYQYTDLDKNNTLSSIGSEHLTSLLSDVRYVSYDVQVQSDFAIEEWTPDMPFDIKPTIYIELLQADRSKDAFFDKAIAIQTILNDHHFNYESAKVYSTTSSEIDGGIYYETQYEVTFTPFQQLKMDDISED